MGTGVLAASNTNQFTPLSHKEFAMALDLTAAAGALKKFYLPGVRNQINNKTILLEQIERGSEHVEGDNWVLSLQVLRNSGVGARGENDTSPTAGAQKYVQATGAVKEIRGRIQITLRVIKAMASNKGSFVRAVDSEMKGITNDVQRDVNRQVAGTSDGVIATCGVTTAAVLVVLAATTPKSAMRQLEVGMVIDIGTLATPTTIASARTITANDPVGKTITISGAVVTTSAAHFIFRSGAGGNAPQLETFGLQTNVKDTGVLYGVDPATYPNWASFVKDAASGPINDPLLEEGMDEVDLRGGEELDLWYASYGVFREYGNYLSVMKRAPQTVDLKGGHKALSIVSGGGSASITRDRDIPDGTAFGLNTKHLFAPEMSDWEFMDDDGAVLSRVANSTAYEATLVKFMDFVTDKRNAHCLVKNIAE